METVAALCAVTDLAILHVGGDAHIVPSDTAPERLEKTDMSIPCAPTVYSP